MSSGELPKYLILRCCRDWPVQIDIAYRRDGRCGLCGKVPDLVFEEYTVPSTEK